MTFIFQLFYRLFCVITFFFAVGMASFYGWQWHEREQMRDFAAWEKLTGNPNQLTFEEWKRIK